MPGLRGPSDYSKEPPRHPSLKINAKVQSHSRLFNKDHNFIYLCFGLNWIECCLCLVWIGFELMFEFHGLGHRRNHVLCVSSLD